MHKVLVTGGAGYIGSVLIPFLLDVGFKVTVYDSLLYGGHSLISFIPNKNFSFIKDDIQDNKSLSRSIKKNDVIIHLAAIVGLPACNKDEKLSYSTTVEETKNVVGGLSRNQQLIYASTVSNYGASTDEACDEKTALKPILIMEKLRPKQKK